VYIVEESSATVTNSVSDTVAPDLSPSFVDKQSVEENHTEKEVKFSFYDVLNQVIMLRYK
jgi:hypothetical protein